MQEHQKGMGASDGPTGQQSHEAWVRTCSAADCGHNDHTRCQAPNIRVVKHESHADCGTYEPAKS